MARATIYRATAPRLAALNDCHQPIVQDGRAGMTPAERPPGRPETLQPHPQLQLLPLDEAHVVAFVPSLSQVAVLDRQALAFLRRLPLPAAALDTETRRLVQLLDGLGILSADGAIPAPPPPDTLVAWLHVTNACNLRCHYCYIAKSSERMSADTAAAAVDATLRSAIAGGYRRILLKYAGGEPLLALDTVTAAHRRAQEQAARAGISLDAGLLSNGTGLTVAHVQTILALGLRLTVSLDGLDQANDAQRPTLGGAGSARSVQQAILRALDGGLRPDVAVTVTRNNIASLPELVNWLLAHGLRFSLSLYREGGHAPNSGALRPDEQQIVDGMRAAYAAVAARPPEWSVLDALLDRADLSGAHARTCAVGENYLVIDQRGQIARCQMELDRPVTDIRADDPLALIRSDQIGVRNLPVDEKEGCRSCEWRYWCAGGCAVETKRASGRYDVRSPHCAIYKALFPDLLRLEGLRILHWSQHAA